MHSVREAVGVSCRWVSLLPPSWLQPRMSPIGCDGIRHSVNIQPKKEEWCPPRQRAGTPKRSSAAHKCREEKINKQTKNCVRLGY